MSDQWQGASHPERSDEAKAETRRWLQGWKHVNRAARAEVQSMTDEDTRAALRQVLDGDWPSSGAPDDGEGLLVFQRAMRGRIAH